MRIRVARSGRKHRIGNAHILAAMRNAGKPRRHGDQPWYLAPDDRGVELVVIAIPSDKNPGDLTVIHAAPRDYHTWLPGAEEQ